MVSILLSIRRDPQKMEGGRGALPGSKYGHLLLYKNFKSNAIRNIPGGNAL